jgi:hypothetical protein
MRYLLLLPLLFSISCHADPLPDEFELASRLEQDGAAQLALAHVEAAQPAHADGARWSEWEQLRLSLLTRLDRPQEVLRRVSEWPRDGVDEATQAADWFGVKAALEVGQGALARDYLARLFWQSELTPDAYREARQSVAQSYIVEGRPADAYPVMLRLRQDFPQLPPSLMAQYVEALLQTGHAEQAATWLPQLADGDPLKLLVRLEAGLITPDAAVDAARQAQQEKPATGNWKVILKAGQMQNNAAWQVEALEQLLAAPKSMPGGSGEKLWQSYLEQADAAGNQLHLLVGDDAAWSEQATLVAPNSPLTARALLAYLAMRSKDAELRADAQLRLISSLAEHKLGATAVRLFEQKMGGDLTPASRFQLGELAAQAGEYSFAARLWHDLDAAPSGTAPQQWQLRRAEVLVKGGAYAEASQALRLLLAGKDALPPEAAGRVREAALEMFDAGQEDAAQQIFKLLLPTAPVTMQSDILARLGAMAESRKDYKLAADYFLQSALSTSAATPVAFAVNARFAAAVNLDRAGFKQDARAQYQSVLENGKDATQQEAARRALSRL